VQRIHQREHGHYGCNSHRLHVDIQIGRGAMDESNHTLHVDIQIGRGAMDESIGGTKPAKTWHRYLGDTKKV